MVHQVNVALTHDEVVRLSRCVVRAIWTDIGEGEWIEDIVETLDGDELAASSDPMMSRVLRKLLLAIAGRQQP